MLSLVLEVETSLNTDLSRDVSVTISAFGAGVSTIIDLDVDCIASGARGSSACTRTAHGRTQHRHTPATERAAPRRERASSSSERARCFVQFCAATGVLVWRASIN